MNSPILETPFKHPSYLSLNLQAKIGTRISWKTHNADIERKRLEKTLCRGGELLVQPLWCEYPRNGDAISLRMVLGWMSVCFFGL